MKKSLVSTEQIRNIFKKSCFFFISCVLTGLLLSSTELIGVTNGYKLAYTLYNAEHNTEKRSQETRQFS